MKRRSKKTPFFGTLLLKAFLPESDREFLLEDFNTVYTEIRENRGKIYAWFWYWIQVLKTAPQFFIHSIIWSIDMFKNYLKSHSEL